MNLRMYRCVCLSMYARMYVYMCMCTHTRTYMHYTHMVWVLIQCVCLVEAVVGFDCRVYVCMYVCTHAYMYVNMHACKMNVCIHLDMYGT